MKEIICAEQREAKQYRKIKWPKMLNFGTSKPGVMGAARWIRYCFLCNVPDQSMVRG